MKRGNLSFKDSSVIIDQTDGCLNFNDNYYSNKTIDSFISKQYNYHDTTHSPVVLYQFNGNINDSSVNGYHLSVLYGTQQYMTLENGLTGFYFNNSTLLYAPTVSALQIVGDCTLEAIISPMLFTTTNPICFSCGGVGETTSDNDLYRMMFITNTLPSYLKLASFWEYGSGTNVLPISNINVKLYDIYHIAIVRSGSSPNVTVNMFINGIKVYTETNLTSPEKGGSLSQRLQFGGIEFGGHVGQFHGVIASAKIIASALTDEQVLSEYRRTIGR